MGALATERIVPAAAASQPKTPRDTVPDVPPPPVLTSRERTHLKARAHHLKPVVRVGHAGVSEAVIGEVDRALAARELIKVQIDDDDRERRSAAAEGLATRTGSVHVQRVGKIVVLWRPKPEDEGAGDAS